MTLLSPTMGGPSMGRGLDIVPPPPAPSTITGFYAPFGPVFSALIGLARTGTVRLIPQSEVRAKPNLPPSQIYTSPLDIVAYVSGPKPRRAADRSLTGVSELKITATYDSVTVPPDIDMQLEFEGEFYVVETVRRLPNAGPVVAWRIIAVRGS